MPHPRANGPAAPAHRTRVLITSVGSLVGTNLLEALARLGRDRFHVIGTNSESEALNNFACDVVYRVPATASGEPYRAALRTIGEREQPELWIPARDSDVLELARMAAQAPLPGVALVGSPATAEIIGDKWLSVGFALEHGLSVAPSANSLDDALSLATTHGFPLIVKPRCGNGSIGTRLVTDPAQLQRAMAMGDCVAQRMIAPAPDWSAHLPDTSAGWPLWYSYVDPGQYASQWMVAPDGTALEIGATLNTMRCGKPERSERVVDATLSRTAGDYARALSSAGWRGPLNVQCRRDDHGDFFMFELAGRFAGGLGGREVLGLSETQTVLAAIFPDRFAPPDAPNTDWALSLKQPQTVGIARDALRQFRDQGVWRRSC